MTVLVDALTSPDSDAPIVSGRLAAFAQDGTCTVDLGAGRVLPGVLRPAGVSLAVGDTVLLTRCDATRWLVLCRPATTAPVTIPAAESWLMPWNVTTAAATGAANPLVVNATDAGSWAFNSWADSTVKQGYYSSSSAIRYGAWWYGPGAFAPVAGRVATSLTLRVSRPGSGGVNTALPVHARLHLDPTRPGGGPTWHGDGGAAPTGPAWSAAATVSLPTWWGQALIDGTAAGVGLYYPSSGDYAVYNDLATDAACGQLALGWS